MTNMSLCGDFWRTEKRRGQHSSEPVLDRFGLARTTDLCERAVWDVDGED